MRIGVDCTAAARQGGGIGRYTRELMRAVLASRPDHDFTLMAGTAGLEDRWATEVERLKTLAPGRVTARSIPLSDDWMARIWHRLHVPIPATWITGAVDLFYAPDFLLPPLPPKVRKVVTIHDLSFLRHPETFTPQLRDYLTSTVPRSARSADRVLTDSEWTRQDVVELLEITPDRVTALHLGVSGAFGPDPLPGERRHLESAYGLGEQPYVLAVGTVQPRKNYGRLIDAIDRVRERLDIALVIAGRLAWLSEPIIDAAASRPYVQLLGFFDDGDLPALYRQASAFAFPSLYEGFGLPPLEAMASGTPVVASTASSVPESVGTAGLLHDPLDVEGLADALVRALTDDALRADLRRKGLARAAQFTWARTAQEWLTAVQST